MPCYKTKDGIHICGDLGPHCAECADVGSFLCDYPVGKDKTCDRHMCSDHATEVAPDLHYCAGHTKMWKEFEESGGVKSVLENVSQFKRVKT